MYYYYYYIEMAVEGSGMGRCESDEAEDRDM